VWDVRIVENTEPTTRRDARKHKVLSHLYTDTPVSVWIDGGRRINKNPIPFIKQALKKSDLLAGVHGGRDCIYDEAHKCISVNKGNTFLILAQIEKYRKEGYPRHNGMINSTVLIRRLTPAVIKFEIDWWNEIKNGCCRDQVSFNYVAWKNDFKYKYFKWREFVDQGGHRR